MNAVDVVELLGIDQRYPVALQVKRKKELSVLIDFGFIDPLGSAEMYSPGEY
jgi:hypothetical protein